MDEFPGGQPEETLDPEDWQELRSLGHRMLDEALDYIQTLRQRPPWQHAPQPVREHFQAPLNAGPQPLEHIYQEYLDYIRPHQFGNNHPRFWGWVLGCGTVTGMLAEMLAASSDAFSGSFSYISNTYVELQVLDWCKQMLGYPQAAGGLLTSGGSASNLIALATARNTRAGYDLRAHGLWGAPQPMTVYCSEQAHSSNQKAVELLGFGSQALRRIPTNAGLQIDLAALRRAVRSDREAGLRPLCAIGVAGTTGSGAVDDLDAIADICEEEGLWFHVDGAFGAWAAIAPRARRLVAGMQRSDSLAFDLHKWMYMGYPIGCVLVKRGEEQRRAFSLTPDYLAHGEGERGLTGWDVPWLADYGFELSRGFQALKAWMALKEAGAEKFGRLIQQNIDQAHYLGELVQAAPELELALPVSLNIACFRYVRPGLEAAELDRLNKLIEVELQERGIAVPSAVTIQGRTYLHVAVTNHRSRREDFELLVREVVRLGQELAGI